MIRLGPESITKSQRNLLRALCYCFNPRWRAPERLVLPVESLGMASKGVLLARKLGTVMSPARRTTGSHTGRSANASRRSSMPVPSLKGFQRLLPTWKLSAWRRSLRLLQRAKALEAVAVSVLYGTQLRDQIVLSVTFLCQFQWSTHAIYLVAAQ